MNIYPGMQAADDQGSLGFVREVGTDPRTGLGFVVIRGADDQLTRRDLHSFTVENDLLLLGPAHQRSLAPGPQQNPAETQVIMSSPTEISAEAMQLAPGQELKVPVIAEQAVVQKRQVEGGGVRVHKTVHDRQEIVEQELTRQEVEIHHVPINRYVEAAPAIRELGDTTIIPVMEEVLVVEKRLLLKEEIHLIRRQVTETQQAEVTLRQEQVEIEQLDAMSDREVGH